MQVPGVAKTLYGAPNAPIRYVGVANFSQGGATLTIYKGEAAGEVLATVAPNQLIGWPVADLDAVTVAAAENAPEPAAGDQVLFVVDTAHLPPVVASL